MEFYIYQADVYCADCAKAIRAEIVDRDGRERADEIRRFSDQWPQGPYADEESDIPQHCAACHTFLRNPLTEDGYAYVIEAWNAEFRKNEIRRIPSASSYIAWPHETNSILAEWIEYYGSDYCDDPETGEIRSLRSILRLEY